MQKSLAHSLNKHVQYINKIAYEEHSKYKRDVIMKRLKKLKSSIQYFYLILNEVRI